jgi:plasmid maintenance system antidote protein VapI
LLFAVIRRDEVTIRLDKAFGADMETLMRIQSNYDIAKAKQRQDKIQVPPYR